MTLSPHRPRPPISSPLVAVSVLLFLAGIPWGLAVGAGKSVPVHDPGANALGVHLVIVACAVIGGGAWLARFRRIRGHFPDYAGPWRESTWRAIRATFTTSVPRSIVLAIALAVAAYMLLRLGMQVGFVGQPAEYVNAWGGPTYLGAFGAHLLDGALVAAPFLALGRAAAVR